MADGIFMDRISKGLAKPEKCRAGFAVQIESQLSDCNRSTQGAKWIRRLARYTARTDPHRAFRHNFITIARTKMRRTVNCITSMGRVLRYSVSGELN
jgi:hypothetical protein